MIREAACMSETRYVAASPSDNWLLIQLDGGERVSLPYGLKVEFHGRSKQRDSFTIAEGVHKGKRGSVVQKSANESYLTATLAHLPGGRILFDTKSQRLKFGNSGPYNAFSGSGPGVENGRAVTYTAVAPGSYALAIPAYPSNKTRAAYGQWTRYHKTWFRLGLDHRGSRFLHAGEISDGCVTVRQFVHEFKPNSPPVPSGFEDLANAAGSRSQGLLGLPLPARPAPAISFDRIYDYLILRRLNDQAVGTLLVTNDGSL